MPLVVSVWRLLAADPRHGQIATLATLLAFGLTRLHFDLTVAQIVVTVGTALAVQAAADSYTGRNLASGARSALISALSLCLLLRTDALVLAAARRGRCRRLEVPVRIGGKHVFNPTNLALVALLADDASARGCRRASGARTPPSPSSSSRRACWSSTGRPAATSRWPSCRATRALLIARSLWLGEPLTIPLHRLESGAFLSSASS